MSASKSPFLSPMSSQTCLKRCPLSAFLRCRETDLPDVGPDIAPDPVAETDRTATRYPYLTGIKRKPADLRGSPARSGLTSDVRPSAAFFRGER